MTESDRLRAQLAEQHRTIRALSREQIENWRIALQKTFASRDGFHAPHAADHLNALCDMALRSLSEPREPVWIAVSERLPVEGATVIGYWPGVSGGSTSIATVMYEPPYGWHDPEDDEDTFAEPSHWMPLPERPSL